MNALVLPIAASTLAMRATLASAAPSIDPIFPAIDAHKAADAFHSECITKADRLEQAYFAALREWDEKPEADLAEGADRLLGFLQETRPATTLADGRRILDAVARQEIAKTHADSLTEVDRIRGSGADAAFAGMRALFETVPTTPAGIAAMIRYTLDEICVDGMGVLDSDGGAEASFGETLLRSILASVSQPS